jgi:ribosomal protein L34E
MDRAELSGAIKAELGAVFMDALTAAGPALLTGDLDGLERPVQALGRQVLGRVVERVVAARAAATSAPPPACGQCGGPTRCVGRGRPRQVQGLVGDYRLHRPYDVCAACHTGQAPLDAQVGLDGGKLSPGLSRVACWLGLAGSCGAAADQRAETLGVMVPEEAVRRITAGVGAVAEAEQQARIARAQRGQPRAPRPLGADEMASPLLVVQVDGVPVPLVGAWHELKVSRVAPLGPALGVDPETGRTPLALGPSSYGAGLEPAEACWWRAYSEACRQGLGTWVRVVVVLGDGAEWIWAQARRCLGLPGVEVVERVDIYHAYAHLWTVGNAVLGVGTPAAAAWVEPLKDRLSTEGAAPVLAALTALTPPAAAAAEAVRLALGYCATHAARMA